MNVYFPIKLQNVASLLDCTLTLLLQVLDILIRVIITLLATKGYKK